MNISIKEDTLYVSSGDEQLCKSYVENISHSDMHTLILGSRYHCKILISYLTGYVYMNIECGDIWLTYVEKIENVTINIEKKEVEDVYLLLNSIEMDAIDTCIQHANDMLYIDTSKIPTHTESIYRFDISIEHMEQYLDSEERAMGYAHILYLYKKYGITAIEYLWII
jgi:hypothetical protein